MSSASAIRWINRRIALVAVLLTVASVVVLPGALPAYSAHGNGNSTETVSLDNCSASYHSASGLTDVQVCPTVVASGRAVSFQVHTLRNQPVSVLLRYPNGTSDHQSGTTDEQGRLLLSLPVHYNPLYRYGQIPFLLTVGDGNAEVVSGMVRVAQTTVATPAKLRVRPVTAKAWCGGDHCVVKDNSSVLIRVETDANAQVQIALQYPNGESVPCPGNDLTGGAGLFADNLGVFECRLPVYYELPNARSTVVVSVQATITTSTYAISLQEKLWLKAK